jgi:hypothetical protein
LEVNDTDKTAVLMQHVRDQGFGIVDLGLVQHGEVLRFQLSQEGKQSQIYLDVDAVVWHELTQNRVLRLADEAMQNLAAKEF